MLFLMLRAADIWVYVMDNSIIHDFFLLLLD